MVVTAPLGDTRVNDDPYSKVPFVGAIGRGADGVALPSAAEAGMAAPKHVTIAARTASSDFHGFTGEIPL
ncbi:hypothetical protein [Nakamurella panacisegetis]|uniref:hypothetical protein n=1 Tax=Nakamurella panacisegetis TaxID=1090615 RepID=UPI0012FD63C6|nr:hypothetical protein [Nakamurella panacisegetis]